MVFVWPYIESHRGELRNSLRCVLRIWPDATLVVVGDDPGFREIHHIEFERDKRSPYHDTNRKLLLAGERFGLFVWMADDIFILKEIDLTRTYREPRPRPNSEWGRLGRKSGEIDYATHMPFLFNGELLKGLNQLTEPVIAETWYGNQFWEPEAMPPDARLMLDKIETAAEKMKTIQHYGVLVTFDETYSFAESYLNELLS